MSRRRKVVMGIASVLVVILAVVDLLLVDAVRDDRREAEAKQEAMRGARELVPVLLSYDHKTLGDDLAHAREATTGKFRDDFDELVASVVRPTATERRVRTSAVVSAAGVISSTSPDRVAVLVFVTQTSSSSVQKSPVVTGSRVKVLMAKKAGRWLIAGLDPV